MNATHIANAFNTQSDKKTWKANAYAGRTVTFDSGGIITLTLDVNDMLWRVKFNKFHATWGDYIKAIARSFYVVLNTLKSAGMPFEAPPSPAGIVIEATATEDNTVFVRWPGDTPPRDPFRTQPTLFAAFGAAQGKTLDEIHQTGLDVLAENNSDAGNFSVDTPGE